MQPLIAGPLTSTGLAPFGRVVAGGTGTGIAVNAGTAERFELADHLANRTGTTVPSLAVYVCRPQQLPVSIPLLERHPLTSQSFLPLSCGRWLIVVAPSDSRGAPVLDGVRAFVPAPGQGITYAPGVWHSPLIVLDQMAELVMLMWEAFGPADCELAALPEPLHVRL